MLRSALTDQELLRAYARRRDVDSLGTFVARYQHGVLRYATHLLGDHHAAEDVVQETFLEVAKAPARLLGIDSCHNWLLRVARNKGVDHIRRRERQRRHTEAAAETRARATGASGEAGPREEPGEALVREEERQRVRRAIDTLPARQRELLLLRIQEGKSYREIAEITGLTATNVGFILHTAVKALAATVAGRGEEDER